MKAIYIGFIIVCFFIFSCNYSYHKNEIERAKKEITDTEKDFAQLCKKEGIEVAFLKYASDDAVIHRDNKVLKGKEEIKAFYKNGSQQGSSLDWAPDFVDVSASCDLGYTYGHYTFTSTDSAGNTKEYKGIFHTVWKKQKDGKWRFVWD